MKNGKGGNGLVREERLQIMLSPEELKAVDTFRFVVLKAPKGAGTGRGS